MLTNPTPWRTADTTYQSHHGACPQCRAAGLNPSGPSRCTVGAGLWADYQAAGAPPHFKWLLPKQEATA